MASWFLFGFASENLQEVRVIQIFGDGEFRLRRRFVDAGEGHPFCGMESINVISGPEIVVREPGQGFLDLFGDVAMLDSLHGFAIGNPIE